MKRKSAILYPETKKILIPMGEQIRLAKVLLNICLLLFILKIVNYLMWRFANFANLFLSRLIFNYL